jgi:hypothetical protein
MSVEFLFSNELNRFCILQLNNNNNNNNNNVTCISSARQRLAKHVPEPYAANKNRRPLLDNGFSYHGTKHVSGTTLRSVSFYCLNFIFYAYKYCII